MVLKEQDTRIIETLDNEEEVVTFEEKIQPCTGELLVVQWLLQSWHVELDQSQRDNLFHTCCKVLENICFVIVDSDSCCNCCKEREQKKHT